MNEEKIDYVSMGHRIRNLRKDRNVTQSALAEKLEISTAYLGLLERGARIPSIDTLRRIAETLDVTLDDIVSGKEESEPLTLEPMPFEKRSDTLPQKMQMLNDVIRDLDIDMQDWVFPPRH